MRGQKLHEKYRPHCHESWNRFSLLKHIQEKLLFSLKRLVRWKKKVNKKMFQYLNRFPALPSKGTSDFSFLWNLNRLKSLKWWVICRHCCCRLFGLRKEFNLIRHTQTFWNINCSCKLAVGLFTNNVFWCLVRKDIENKREG